MNYQETINSMFSQLPMFQRIGKAAYKADLSNTIALLKSLNNPEKGFKSIHIAGTNGKGSSSHILASVFQEAGYKTGLYTSPHLIDFRERIKIDGEMITEPAVVNFIKSISKAIDKIHPSFFELTMAMAFDYFLKEKVDIAIIETGLGGRLDSTNVILPEIAIITNIGMDHMQFLGDDRISIAKEKAGIIKANVPVVIGQADEELRVLFTEIAGDKKSPITFAEDEIIDLPITDLKGNYQRFNIQTCIVAIKELQKRKWKISTSSIEKGISKVISNTGLNGRWQVLGKQPKIICDTGHNREGIESILHQLLNEDYKQLHIVIGMVNDKNISDVLRLFPQNAIYYFTQASIPRRLEVDTLLNEAANFNLEGEAYSTVSKAFFSAYKQAKSNDLVFIGGSTFVVADLLKDVDFTQLQ
jgi:dihydrofolate synthase/folylpolyglutamate synthase